MKSEAQIEFATPRKDLRRTVDTTTNTNPKHVGKPFWLRRDTSKGNK